MKHTQSKQFTSPTLVILSLILSLIAIIQIPRPVAANDSHHEGPHWSYKGEGGPSHWGSLKPEFASCSEGKTQSPIDLRWSKPTGHRTIGIEYQPSSLKLIDNGHTIQANFDPGSKVKIAGKEYDLLQVHFHAGSEHKLSNQSFPLEAHFVHKSATGELAVVGVFLKVGKPNPWIENLWSHLPSEKGKEVTVPSVKIDPAGLYPESKTHYHYMGSLTTPPCSEGVNWNVLNTPVELSSEQLAQFVKIYSDNARPVQPLHQRKPANFE